jgi:CheY-like chemotaxis protein
MSWSPNGDSIIIWSEESLGKVLPNYGFKTDNFSAFQRQLNYYGFRKVTQGKPTHYAHECFYRASQRLHEIKKRTQVSKTYSVPVPVTVPMYKAMKVCQPEVIEIDDDDVLIREQVQSLKVQQQSTQSMMVEILKQLQQSQEESKSLRNLVEELAQQVCGNHIQKNLVQENFVQESEVEEPQVVSSNISFEEQMNSEETQVVALNMSFEGIPYEEQTFVDTSDVVMLDIEIPQMSNELQFDAEIEEGLRLDCSADIDKLENWLHSLSINV